jgi:hypothetical protein
MEAIFTKALSPTDRRQSSVKATIRHFDGMRSIIRPYDHAMSLRDNHAAVAMALVRQVFDGGNNWIAGETKDGYVFVMQGEEFSKHFGLPPI